VSEELKRLAEIAESIEAQARELREQIARLVQAPPPEAIAEVEDLADLSEARIVAYSMVLDGKPREEVAQHLAEELGLTDSDALLDDLYARAGG
jgi:predicted RNA-binding Zn ribbon-like protein